MLHILNKPPYSDVARQMLQTISADDELVLIEEGVQAALYPNWEGWKCASRTVLLQEDVASRGFQVLAAAKELSVIDIAEFVTLTEQHLQIISWY